MRRYIQITDAACGNEWWKELVSACAVCGEMFEIHCWADERDAIREALRFGTESDSSWHGGKVVRGYITVDFLQYLLRQPKPLKKTGYNMMTPFFTIHFADRLMSEHYGAEMIICNVPAQKQQQISKALSAIASKAAIHDDP